jgi:spermidine synthase
LLNALGVRGMLWSAAGANVLIAAFAWLWSRPPDPGPGGGGESSTAPPPAPAVATCAGGASPSWMPLAAAGLTGAVFSVMELVWYRMLAPLLGGSAYSFAVILAVALAGIGAGGLAYSIGGGVASSGARGFAVTCAAQALGLGLPLALGDRLALTASLLQPLGAFGLAGLVAVWGVIAIAVVFPAAFLAGIQFPLLLAWSSQLRGPVGRQLGLLYACNAGGAMLGALAGGFVLLPLLSAPGVWRLMLTLLVCAAAVALAVGPRPRRLLPVPAGLLAAALACLLADGPTAAWRHAGIGVGQGPRDGTPNSLRQWVYSHRRALLWQKDGRESSIAVDVAAGYSFVVNGKADGHAREDAPTQVMGGLLGALLHGHVRRAAVIGLGTGSTAGWLAALPDVQSVEVAELEPAVLRVARDCGPVNRQALSNPKLRLFVGDAREYLQLARARYDLVFSEPSNPYRAGVASLFTEEFYRAVDRRLADGGLFAQWLQTYSIDTQTVRTIYATLAAVFPHVETWVTKEEDLLLVATRQPLVHDPDALGARLAAEPYRSALESVWFTDDLPGLFAHFVAGGGLATAIARAEHGRLNTDDRPRVELGFARTAAARVPLFDLDGLRAAAQQHRAERPRLLRGSIDWQAVGRRRLSMLASQGRAPPPPPAGSPEQLRRQAAYRHWLEGRCAAALAAWGEDAAEDPLERLMLAECRADAGDPHVLSLLDSLRAHHAIEADVILARLRLQQDRLAESARVLESALLRYRRDPWPLPALMARALALIPKIAARDRALGERLHRVLASPFAVHVIDDRRRSLRFSLAGLLDFPRLCRDELVAAEPWVPWREDMLRLRLRCYQLTGDSRQAEASRDLARFLRDQGPSLSAGFAGL